MIDITELMQGIRLSAGSHASPEKGMCAMEFVAWLDGLPHSDKPECACPVIGAYVIGLNDRMPDEWRQKLIAFLPRLVGSRSPGHEQERAEYLAWQAIRVFAPAALRARGLEDHATKLENARTLQEARKLARAAASRAAYTVAAKAASASAASASASRAASAARAAASAANASAYAAAAAAGGIKWPLALKALDGVLQIGASGRPVAEPIPQRIEAYRELIRV